jgi:hypothetical protein
LALSWCSQLSTSDSSGIRKQLAILFKRFDSVSPPPAHWHPKTSPLPDKDSIRVFVSASSAGELTELKSVVRESDFLDLVGRQPESRTA